MELTKLSLDIKPNKFVSIFGDSSRLNVGMLPSYGTEYIAYVALTGALVFKSDWSKVYFKDGGEAWQL